MVDQLGSVIEPRQEKQLGVDAGSKRPPAWFWLFSALLIAFGIFMRIANLATSPIWHDEAMIILHAQGYTKPQMINQIAERLLTAKELKDNYQTQASGKGLPDALLAVGSEHPDQMPLFTVLLHAWLGCFGEQNVAIRMLPLTFGLLQLAAAFWWAAELVGTSYGGLIACTLLMGSPIAILYSQEVGDYSLYMLLTTLATAALLRAERMNGWRNWFLYCLFMGLGLNSSFIFIATLMAHICYMVVHTRKSIRLTSEGLSAPVTLYRSLVAQLVALATFLPFAYLNCFGNLDQALAMTSWIYAGHIPAGDLFNSLLANLAAIFYWPSDGLPAINNSVLAALYFLGLLWIATTYFNNERGAFSLLACFIIPLILLYWLPDVVLGGQRCLYVRFYLFAPLSVLMFATCALTKQLSSNAVGAKLIALFSLFIVAASEVASDLPLLKLHDREMVAGQSMSAVANVLKNDNEALLVSAETSGNGIDRCNIMQIVALSHVVPPNTRFLWLDHKDVLNLPPDTNHFYLLNPPLELLNTVKKKGFIVKPVDNMNYCLIATAN